MAGDAPAIVAARRPRKVHREDELWIATSRYHQARCWALFAAHGIQTHVVPSLPDRFDLPLRKLLWFWVREFFALPYDVFMTIVTPRTDPNSAIR